MAYAEWDAAVEAGLDLWKWEMGLYPTNFMARVIAFNNLRRLVKLHSEDAVARKMDSKAKR